MRETRVRSLGREDLREKAVATHVLLPGKSHGPRSLVGYSPWDRKESDTTERLHFHFHFEHSLALPFFGIGMKTDLFQSCGHCWVFQICRHIELSTFTASSFRIWNSSTRISSPPLALLVAIMEVIMETVVIKEQTGVRKSSRKSL